jgi:hypothetical protein
MPVTPNKAVARFQDGRVLKGVTSDFLPAKDSFHLASTDGAPGSRPTEVRMTDLKAVFFVKDFEGDPTYHDRQEFDRASPSGRKIRVTFKDGEVLVGMTQGYQPGRPGFFVIPADPRSNIERCFVVTGFTQDIALL